jgi:hypothetical protein
VPTGPASTAPASQASRPQHSDTIRRLNLHSIGLVVATVLFGIAGALAFIEQSYAVNRAEDSTAQLIRVQDIQTYLLSADATVTNAFLVGGLEPTSQRATYDQAIEQTAALVADAAEAQPADREALSALNQLVVEYAATVEQARANNRQGLPVGAQYLRDASAQLRAEALPIMDNLVQANADRASDRMDSSAVWWFLLVGVLVLAALGYSQYWVARRFKRTINLGLAAGTVVVVVALLAGVVLLGSVASKINDVEDGPFSVVTAAAQARIAAYDAKANESLTLISRGSGAAFEEAWVARADDVTSQLDVVDQIWGETNAQTDWTAYTDVHENIRELDDGGQWEQAVEIAIGTDPQTSSNGTFGTFDDGLSTTLDQASADADAGLSDVGPVLVIGTVLLLVAGGVSALLAWWGLSQRLKEYR